MAKHGGVKDSGEYFVINPTTRKVTVPHAHKSIATVGDHNSEQITFECPQIIDGHDISQCDSRYVTWVNVLGEYGHDKLELTQVEQGADGMIYLKWTIRNPLTVDKGIVQFSVHFEDVEARDIITSTYRWSTATCKDCEILDSINQDLGVYEEIYVDGEKLVIADYNLVKDKKLHLGTDGIVPEGTLYITENGTHNVRNYKEANVNVVTPIPDGYIKPEGSIHVTTNGTFHNLSQYETVFVQVPQDSGNTPTINVSESGLITASANGKSATHQLSVEDDPDFNADNIRYGKTILGVQGNAMISEYSAGSINNIGTGYIRVYSMERVDGICRTQGRTIAENTSHEKGSFGRYSLLVVAPLAVHEDVAIQVVSQQGLTKFNEMSVGGASVFIIEDEAFTLDVKLIPVT